MLMGVVGIYERRGVDFKMPCENLSRAPNKNFFVPARLPQLDSARAEYWSRT